jgi:transcription initiation factor TFIID subunit 7
VNPDLSDSEFIEQEAPTPAISDMADAPTPGGDIGDGEDEEPEENEEEDPDGDIDEELAAELDLALGDDDVDEDDEDDESEEEDSEDEDDEDAQARKLLSEEIRDLEAAVAKKGNEIASSGNPLIRVRSENSTLYIISHLETSRNASRMLLRNSLRTWK